MKTMMQLTLTMNITGWVPSHTHQSHPFVHYSHYALKSDGSLNEVEAFSRSQARGQRRAQMFCIFFLLIFYLFLPLRISKVRQYACSNKTETALLSLYSMFQDEVQYKNNQQQQHEPHHQHLSSYYSTLRNHDLMLEG